MSEVEQLMMVWRNPSTGEIYYPASYVERLRAALASIADSADFKDFAENEAAWMQGVARKALANSNAAETSKSPWCGSVHTYGPGFTCRKLAGHIGPHGCHDATGQLCEWPAENGSAEHDK